MIDHDEVPVARHPAGVDDGARGGRVNRRARAAPRCRSPRASFPTAIRSRSSPGPRPASRAARSSARRGCADAGALAASSGPRQSSPRAPRSRAARPVRLGEEGGRDPPAPAESARGLRPLGGGERVAARDDPVARRSLLLACGRRSAPPTARLLPRLASSSPVSARARCARGRASQAIRSSWRPIVLSSSRLSSRSENEVVPSAKEIRSGESDS